ncbi:transcription elongation factor A protein 1 [Tripterygium wilfordii]|uniref:Transcription elongation factor A protein 1 n=1 Tax=Tripterygium wilfordii TaxID=458696 RepID=A0A7J7BYD4_TRIWF|nr:transcription elongation factor TFIIS-like [Tripterygium wilfordii]KAF5726828.1 transcription elongation factor A protein 1 [Tripterygium wilfordii]
MERELLRLIDVARRTAMAASAINNVSHCEAEVFRCLDALKRLQDFPMTPSLIESTQGELFPLTKHPIVKIRTATVSLISKLKNTVSDAKQDKKIIDDTRETKTIVRGNLVIRLKLHRKPTAPTCDSATMSPTQKKASPTNPGNIDISRDKVREVVQDSLSKAVAENGRVSEINPSVLATKIESVMYKMMGSFNGPKKLRYRSILFNLKDPKNPDLRRKVLHGKVTPEALVSMTTEEMASRQRRKEYKQIRKNALAKKHIEAKNPEQQEMEL